MDEIFSTKTSTSKSYEFIWIAIQSYVSNNPRRKKILKIKILQKFFRNPLNLRGLKERMIHPLRASTAPTNKSYLTNVCV